MIPLIDEDCRRWAHWRYIEASGRSYHYRSPLADIRDVRGGGRCLPSGGIRAWAAPFRDRDEVTLQRIEHGVQFFVTAHQRKLVCLRYLGRPTLEPASLRPLALSLREQLAQLGCTQQAYAEALHSAHARLERHILARLPLTVRPGPCENRRTPARVE